MTPAWASVMIASVALAASALATYLSLRLSGRTLTTMSYRSATDLVLELDRVFLDQPQLRPYFYEQAPTPPRGHSEHHRVMAAAEFALDVCECIWDHRHQYSAVDCDAWREWIHNVFLESPTILATYEQNVAWYPTLQELVAKGGCTKGHDYFLSAPRIGDSIAATVP